MNETLLIRREGDAVYVGGARVTVARTECGRVLLSIEAPAGVQVLPAEVADAVRLTEPERRSA